MKVLYVKLFDLDCFNALQEVQNTVVRIPLTKEQEDLLNIGGHHLLTPINIQKENEEKPL